MTGNISVIIPAFNAAAFLEETLNSVAAQTLRPAQVIVVDDGSTDDTAVIAKKNPLVHYVYQSNSGTANALNTGVNLATGDYFAFLDADDLWLPTKLQRQMEIATKDQSVELIFTLIQNFFSTSISDELKQKIELDDRPFTGIHKSTLFAQRATFFKIGLFSPSARIDLLDWYARSKEMKVREVVINEVLAERRIHGSNQTWANKEIKNDFPKIIKGILDRRRLSS